MHTGDQIPVVHPDTPVVKVIEEITRKGFGMTSVVVDGLKLAGVITDGDLRRLLHSEGDWRERTAGQFMSRNPKTIDRRELATRALHLMESGKVTSLLIVDGEGRLEGLLHLHDLWTTQMF